MNTLLLVWLVSLLGFATLALAMERHQRYLALGQPGPWMIHGSRLAGMLLLSIALGLCVIRWQPSVGTAIWLGAITFAALTLGLIFAYCTREACRRLLVAALCLAGVLVAASL